MTIGIKDHTEVLCLEFDFCLAANTPQFPIGLIKEEKKIIKVGLPCCALAVKIPETLCNEGFQLLFLKSGCSLPFKEPVPSPVCAFCCLQCTPNLGCAKPPMKAGGAPPTVEMER